MVISIQVMKEDRNKNCSLPVKVPIPNSTFDTWNEWKAMYFLPADQDRSNKFEKWLNENEGNLDVNAFDSKTHSLILQRWDGSQKLYGENIEQHGQSEIKKYRLLLCAVSMKQQKSAYNSEEYFYPIINEIEGNNRLGALIHLLLGTAYNSAQGKLEVNTLNNTMIVDGLATLPTIMLGEVKKKFKRFHPQDTINQVFEERRSTLYEGSISTVFIYGKPQDEFYTLVMDMEEVKKMTWNSVWIEWKTKKDL